MPWRLKESPARFPQLWAQAPAAVPGVRRLRAMRCWENLDSSGSQWPSHRGRQSDAETVSFLMQIRACFRVADRRREAHHWVSPAGVVPTRERVAEALREIRVVRRAGTSSNPGTGTNRPHDASATSGLVRTPAAFGRHRYCLGEATFCHSGTARARRIEIFFPAGYSWPKAPDRGQPLGCPARSPSSPHREFRGRHQSLTGTHCLGDAKGLPSTPAFWRSCWNGTVSRDGNGLVSPPTPNGASGGSTYRLGLSPGIEVRYAGTYAWAATRNGVGERGNVTAEDA